jgi:hypothetical protein
MPIYSTAQELRNALVEIQPSKIAVAFVGNGWRNYVNPEHIAEIVLSPTLGSNPIAIEAIMLNIGEEHVYFLDNLHAKIYLGTESALLGSSNLSDNGFSDNGNFEAGVVLSDSESLGNLQAVFDDYKTRAAEQYPTRESKIERLRILLREWQNSITNGTISRNLNNNDRDNSSPSIGDYRSKSYSIHVAWYGDAEVIYNETAICAVVPEANNPEDYFESANTFHKDDVVQKGDWILSWRANKNGFPNGRSTPIWLYAHHVILNGALDPPYTMLVGQAKKFQCPPPPFVLDERTIQLIRDALNTGIFPTLLRPNDDRDWLLADADTAVPDFLSYLQDAYNP